MNLAKFMEAKFSARESTANVPPALVDFFGETWTVRGLTAAELARSRESGNHTENLKALVAAFAGAGDKADAIKQSMGLSDAEVPEDIARRIEMLSIGSVSPELGADNRDVAVKLAETHPTFFYDLTNRILSLTGDGAELGKPKGSTKKAASG